MSGYDIQCIHHHGYYNAITQQEAIISDIIINIQLHPSVVPTVIITYNSITELNVYRETNPQLFAFSSVLFPYPQDTKQTIREISQQIVLIYHQHSLGHLTTEKNILSTLPGFHH